MALLLGLVFFLAAAPHALASHYRYGNIDWSPGSGNEVTITVKQAWRFGSILGSPAIGDVVNNTSTLNFGDGTSTPINIMVLSLNSAEDWFFGEFTVTHTYPAAGNYTAFYQECCRINSTQNNPDGNFRSETIINVGTGNHPPQLICPVILNMEQGLNTANFQLFGIDQDGDDLVFRLATAAEVGTGFIQPAGLSISSDGLLSFNTVPTVIGQTWSTTIAAEDLDNGGNPQSKSILDLVIEIVGPSANPPVFNTPTPASGTTLSAQCSTPFTFTVDVSGQTDVTLNVIGMPTGATFTPGLPAIGNPVNAVFTWTPAPEHFGHHLIAIIAEDTQGAQTTTTFSIQVSDIADGDGDGYSAACGGDCDDTDPTVYLNAPEICDGKDNDCDGFIDEGVDLDGDGFYAPNICGVKEDCDDTDAAINPDATEICDFIDNNCDGAVDEGLTYITCYADADMDGYGNPAVEQIFCIICGTGFVLDNTDCDDTNADTYPGAAENESATDCMRDSDGDGYGETSPPAGVIAGTDCADTDTAINPGAPEICDFSDNNCDGTVDEGFIYTICYADTDMDGFGNPNSSQPFCGTCGAGFVLDNTDCDDTNADTYPGAAENESATDCMKDSDGDGYGDTSPPAGVVAGTDCNDSNPAISPVGTEICNGVDDDCANGIDDGLAFNDWYLDSDNDGFGTDTPINACQSPGANYVLVNGDCDDGNPAVNPGATYQPTNVAGYTICQGGSVPANEGLAATSPYNNITGGILPFPNNTPAAIPDNNPTGVSSIIHVAQSLTISAISADVDITHTYIKDLTIDLTSPSGTTVRLWNRSCGGQNNILLNFVSESTNAYGTFPCPPTDNGSYQPFGDLSVFNGLDAQGDWILTIVDHVGTDIGTLQNWTLNIRELISAPVSWWDAATDGNQIGTGEVFDPTAVPPANGGVDPAVQGTTTYWAQVDYFPLCGTNTRVQADFVVVDPGTSADYYPDLDGDGFGDATAIAVSLCGSPSANYVLDNTDCDDSNPAINSDATEVCDFIDNNCDGNIDEGFTYAICYADTDMDGFGDPNNMQEFCAACGTGFVLDNTDCDDTNAATYPGAAENDSATDCMSDSDGDGYGDDSPPAGVLAGTDCNDSNPAINPGVTEICNGVDDDCTNVVDDGLTFNDWYLDNDGDGYGAGTSINACQTPGANYVLLNGDCDDTDAAVNPGATYQPTNVANYTICQGEAVPANEGLMASSPYLVPGGGTNTYYGYGGDIPDGYHSGINKNIYINNSFDISSLTVRVEVYHPWIGQVFLKLTSPAGTPVQLCYSVCGDADNMKLTFDSQAPGSYEGSYPCPVTDGGHYRPYDDLSAFNGQNTQGIWTLNASDAFTGDAGYLFNWRLNITGFTNAPITWWDAPTAGIQIGTGEVFNPTTILPANGGVDANVPGTTTYWAQVEYFPACGTSARVPVNFVVADPSANVNYYPDMDGDGFGDASATAVVGCGLPPANHVSNNSDCDDSNAGINPDAIETCNGIDDDCANGPDDGLPFNDWYLDDDGDGYGTGTPMNACQSLGANYVLLNGDCDDADATISPDASEICDFIDNNCDGNIDEGFIYATYQPTNVAGYTSCQGGSVPANEGLAATSPYNNTTGGILPFPNNTPAAIPDNNPTGVSSIIHVAQSLDISAITVDVNISHTWVSDLTIDLTSPSGTTVRLMNGPCGNHDNILLNFDSESPNAYGTFPCPPTDNGSYQPFEDLSVFNGLDAQGDWILTIVDHVGTDIGTLQNWTLNIRELISAPVSWWDAATDGNQVGTGEVFDPTAVPPANGGVDPSVQGTTTYWAQVDYFPLCGTNTRVQADFVVVDPGTSVDYYPDLDGDGFGDATVTAIALCGSPPANYVLDNTDCDDSNPAINSNATEVCDFIDNNCEGNIDEGFTYAICYADTDTDGFGDPNNMQEFCAACGTGFVLDNTDCDDTNADTYPGAAENESATDCMKDSDGDGYGDDSPPAGVMAGTDCNDSNPAINPSVTEICNGIDDDCSNGPDDGLTFNDWYLDSDNDGFGTGTPINACQSPGANYVLVNGDCDDTNADTYPGAAENESATDCMKDSDGDGYGDDSPPAGVMAGTDCDDNNVGTHSEVTIAPVLTTPANMSTDIFNPVLSWGTVPNAEYYQLELALDELFNNIVHTENGLVGTAYQTQGLDNQTTYYWRTRGRNSCGIGPVSNVFSFTCPDFSCAIFNSVDVPLPVPETGTLGTSSSVLNVGLCGNIVDVNVMNLDISHTWVGDLAIDLTSPNGTTVRLMNEPCGDFDNILLNLDSESPNDLAAIPCPTTDNGTYQSFEDLSAFNGEDPEGTWTLTIMDLVSGDKGILNDWALEICYTPGPNPVVTCYADADMDNYGDPNIMQFFCTSCGTGFVSDNTDCNDSDDSVHEPQVYFLDNDGDGFGSAISAMFCSSTPPPGYSTNNSDCNDSNASINSDVTEICDFVDNNCDGTVDEGFTYTICYADTDMDGYGNPNYMQPFCGPCGTGYVLDNTDCDDTNANTYPGAAEHDSATACMRDNDGDGYGDTSPPAGVIAGTDCADTDAAINPGVPEICDFIDNNCDGIIDEGFVHVTCFADTDMDGFGDPGNMQEFCAACGTGFVLDNTDCDDTNADTYPGAAENESATDCMKDSDGDGYGDTSPPAGVVAGTDCNDSNPAISPVGTEICNGIDDDCVNGIDDGLTFNDWYLDNDGDGFGTGTPVNACQSPGANYVLVNGDCDDGNPAVNPGVTYQPTNVAGYGICQSGSVPPNEGLAATSPYNTIPGGILPFPNNNPAAIPDNNPTGVSSVIHVAQSLDISAITVDVDITHTWVEDLTIDLTSPSGTTVRLMDRPCGNHDNILLNFDSESPNPYGTFPCPPTNNGSYQPFGDLSVFNGLDGQGDWTLTIVDHVNSDAGTLQNWTLNIRELISAPVSWWDAATDGNQIGTGEVFDPTAVLPANGGVDPAIQGTTTYWAQVGFFPVCGTNVRVQADFVVEDPSISISASQTICTSGSATLNATTSGGAGTCTIQWQSSLAGANTWTNIGAGGNSLTVTPTADTDYRATYTCTGGGCDGATSNTVIVTVVADPTISVSAGSATTICSGGLATFNATTSDGTGNCTIQWQESPDGVNFNNMPGENGTSLDIPGLASTTHYRATYTCTGGGCDGATSNTVTVTVVADPTIGISASQTICTGGDATLNASVSGGTGSCTIQWQESPDGVNFNNMPGENGTSLDVPGLTATTHYRATYACTGGGCDGATSNVVTVTVMPDPSISISASQTICTSGSATLNATTSGGAGICNIQWQSSPAGANTWTNIGVGGNSLTVTPTADTDYQATYTCIGGGCDGATSNTVIVTVVADPTISVSAGSATTICSGGLATFNAITSDGTGNCTIQWQESPDGVNFNNMPGENGTSLDIPGLASTTHYRATYTCTGGGCDGATSNTVTVTVVADPTIGISASQTICTGGDATLNASVSGGTGSCTIQWQSSPDGLSFDNMIGENGTSLTVSGLTSTTHYRATYACTGGGCDGATSNVVTVTVVPDPSISISASQTICTSGSATLNATTSGGAEICNIQWQSSPVGANTWTNIGAGGNSLTVTPTVDTDYQATYTCTGGGCDGATSNMVTVTIVPDPSISISASQTICTGGSATLNASASGGTGSCTIQWQESPDGVNFNNMPGENGTSLNIPGLASTTHYRATYTCTGGGCDGATSNTVTVTVVADPTIGISASQTICTGGDATLNASVSGGTGSCTIQWQSSPDGLSFDNMIGENGTSLTVSGLTSTMHYRATYACTGGGCDGATSNVVIIIVDSINPLITCPANVANLEWQLGFNTSPVGPNTPQDSSIDPGSYGMATATDNVCTPTVTYQDVITGPTPGNCPNLWVVTRAWTATDACGLTANCVQTFTFTDTTPPTIVTCPTSPPSIEWPAGFNISSVGPNTPQDPIIDPSNFANITYSDNFAVVSVDYQDIIAGPTPGNCPNLWVVVRTWTVTDACGLTDQCDQIFTFTDTTPPTIANCPASPVPIEWPAGFNINAVPENTPQDPSIVPGIYGTATGSDNGGIPTVSYQDAIVGPAPANCPNLWEVTRTWTATDVCGLTATCAQTFIFTDTTPPSINSCPPAITVEGCGTADIMNGGLTNLPFSTVLTGVVETDFNNEGGAASDNGGIQSYSYQDVASGTCPTVVTRLWTLTDFCGLTAMCTQLINIDDTTLPAIVCQNISVALDNNGEYNLQPSEVYDVANSSDNCSAALTLVSVFPNYFSCPNEGNNVVTLTAEDVCGNQGTCTATVTVAPFLTNVVTYETDETCIGAADGTITASASAPGGQVKYSIDGGVNYQYSGYFQNLSPGDYTITFKVFGIPGTCELETGFLNIATGMAPFTCYKDIDNDNYTDGVTTTSCPMCPTGYKVAGDLVNTTDIDCNDFDPLVNVVKTWYQDTDNDNYTNGTTQTACLRPAGYKTATELVNTTDIDCDDNNPAVNHGSTEVCNGIDDDCDGEIDEGTSGGLAWVGNVYFSTQAQVDAWSACYSVINGSVTIVGAGINNLAPLGNIVEITGNLTIQSTGVTSMTGFGALTTLGGTLTIYFNSSLSTLNGLDALATVGGSFMMYYNFQLSDCCAVYDLINGGVTGPTVIFFNKVGCNSVAEINSNCSGTPLIGSNSGSAFATTSGQIAGKEMGLYPNPARTEVTVRFGQTGSAATLRITDLLGRVVFAKELQEGTDRMVIDLQSGVFENGLYQVSLYENGEMRVKQLVVQQ